MIGCLRTHVLKQAIIALYFEFETVLKFDILGARIQVPNLYLQAKWKLENSVDPDQLASQNPADLD